MQEFVALGGQGPQGLGQDLGVPHFPHPQARSASIFQSVQAISTPCKQSQQPTIFTHTSRINTTAFKREYHSSHHQTHAISLSLSPSLSLSLSFSLFPHPQAGSQSIFQCVQGYQHPLHEATVTPPSAWTEHTDMETGKPSTRWWKRRQKKRDSNCRRPHPNRASM
jgi:hypothetical protein